MKARSVGRTWRRALRRLLLALLPAAGCQNIIGIEERRYEPSTESEACIEYCDRATDNCAEEFALYSTRETCLGACALLDPGDPSDPAGNTVACRSEQARLAGDTNEQAVHCPRAAPGGGGFCGDDCETYCRLFADACPARSAGADDCERKCKGLRDLGRFDLALDGQGDSLQCRLVQVSSATLDPDAHCESAQLQATPPCADPEDTVVECNDYCKLVTAVCVDELAVYESVAQCMNACGALPPGSASHRNQNTVGCRRYHAYNAMVDPETHCPHGGPGGDGRCGRDEPAATGNCVSYCTLLGAACPDVFADAFVDAGACITDCSVKPAEFGAANDSMYRVQAAESGDTLACRLLHAVRAFDDESACEAALGGGSCG